MLRAAGFALLAFAICSSAPIAAQEGPREPVYIYHAKVTKVLEGDLVDMDIDLGFYILIKAQRIKLIGIDAPAPAGDSKAAGDAATEHLRNLIEGKSVIVQTFLGEDAADRTQSFSNWLGRIYLDGKDVNQEMIASGNAVSVAAP